MSKKCTGEAGSVPLVNNKPKASSLRGTSDMEHTSILIAHTRKHTNKSQNILINKISINVRCAIALQEKFKYNRIIAITCTIKIFAKIRKIANFQAFLSN